MVSLTKIITGSVLLILSIGLASVGFIGLSAKDSTPFPTPKPIVTNDYPKEDKELPSV
jgi:hypothetical protein